MVDEIELKFIVKDYGTMLNQILLLGTYEKTAYEQTVMYDNKEKRLYGEDSRLRLRRIINLLNKKEKCELSYKKPKTREGIKIEEEIQVETNSFLETELILEKLGYRKVSSYERIRNTIIIDTCKVTLDIFPFGNLLEVEGETDRIKAVAEKLELKIEENTTKSCDDIYADICVAENRPIGNDIFFEKGTMEKTYKALDWIYKNEAKKFRTEAEIAQLVGLLVNTKPIQIFGVFCPSYKKGPKVQGFNRGVGETSKIGIKNIAQLLDTFKNYGIECYSKVIFADLALENYDRLNQRDLEDLEENYNDLREFGSKINPDLHFLKMSEIPNCKKRIGGSGIITGDFKLNKREIQNIAKRSFPFYKNVLDWDSKKIQDRTETLARSVEVLCEEFGNFENSIMVMTDNMYERGKFYQVGHIVPIFYPKKRLVNNG